MKRCRVLRRAAAVLVCLLLVNMILSLLPSYPSDGAVCAAEQSSPVLEVEEGEPGSFHLLRATPSEATSEEREEREESGSLDDVEATPSEASSGQREEREESRSLDYVEATPSEATSKGREEESKSPPLKIVGAAPLEATPSEAFKEIYGVNTPGVAVLEVGEADEDTWEAALPQQAAAWGAFDGDIQCQLQWSVPYAKWDQAGVYAARIEVIPPEGYMLEDAFRFYDAVVSVHPPGTCQVMEVYTFLNRWSKGHTWTFAMKVGQDMTPLVETLEAMNSFKGLLDEGVADITFSVEWDFSHVDPQRPGIYPIYRSLTLEEESLPQGVRPEDVYLPPYWKDLPVLFSVEEEGGPQLYGALEGPFEFFGSYAKLSQEELASLEVWYSVDGGEWTLQRDQGIMGAYERNFSIDKKKMEEGRSYSFRLKLGDFVSRELTVIRDEEKSPVWFTSLLNGNRDGTIEVEFPSVSQPPPTDPTEGEGGSQPTDPTEGEGGSQPTDPTEGEGGSRPTDPTEGEGGSRPTDPTEGEGGSRPTDPTQGNPPAGDSSGEDSIQSVPPETSGEGPAPGDSGGPGNGSGAGPGGVEGMDPGEGPQPPGLPGPDTGNPLLPGPPAPGAGSPQSPGVSDPGAGNPQSPGGSDPSTGDLQSPGSSDPGRETPRPPGLSGPEGDGTGPESLGDAPGAGTAGTGETEGSARDPELSQGDRPAGGLPVPEEVVTRWTTQISGKRVQKLIELYPNWIRFQKEDVSILLSSQWLRDQQMEDSDVLTISVSPGEDRRVTILINQREPRTSPVCQITVEEQEKEGVSRPAVLAILCLGVAGGAPAVFLWIRRWKF